MGGIIYHGATLAFGLIESSYKSWKSQSHVERVHVLFYLYSSLMIVTNFTATHLTNFLSVLSVLNTSSLLCDCHMQWLGPWLTDSQFQQSVSAVCAHPASLLGRNVLSISPEEFVCGQCRLFSVSPVCFNSGAQSAQSSGKLVLL